MTNRISVLDKMAAKVWLSKAKILILLELNEQALKCLERVLKIDPDHREAIVDNALVLCRLAEKKEGREQSLEYDIIDDFA